MPLHARPVPPAALHAVTAALSSPPQTSPAAARAQAAHAAGAPLIPTDPLPVYLLTGMARAGGPRADFAGWRFLLQDDRPAAGADHPTGSRRTVGTADAAPTGDGWTFSHFGEGPYAASTARCLRQAATLTGPYEPRLLSVPELYMLTLWLRGTAAPEEAVLAADDLLVPLSPAPPGIAPELPCRVDGLLPVLTHRLTPSPLIRTA